MKENPPPHNRAAWVGFDDPEGGEFQEEDDYLAELEMQAEIMAQLEHPPMAGSEVEYSYENY